MVCCDEKNACGHEKEYEQGRGESFVGEVSWRSDNLDDQVMNRAEVVHAILEVAHVAKEVFGHLCSGLDCAWWG